MSHPVYGEGASRPTMLCVCSRAIDPLLQALLPHFDATVVHDGRLALRKGSLGSYDVFLAYDPRGARAPLLLWENMRLVDMNTPFVIVCGGVPPDVEQRLRPGYDALVRYPCGLDELKRTVQRLLNVTERRNLQARSEEARAVGEEIRDRLAHLERRVQLSRQSLARAQEHVVRAIALRAFAASGGTRSHFDQHWPEVFDSALAASYRPDVTDPDTAGG